MLALRSAPPLFDAVEAGRVVRDVYGLTADLRRLSGERDCNYHARVPGGREFVLKIFHGATDAQALDGQIRVLRHLAEQDPTLPVPRVHVAPGGNDVGRVERSGVGYLTCLLSYLPGRVLSGVAVDRALLGDLGRMLARVDRALQGFFHPALAQRIAWDVRRLPELFEFLPLVDSAQSRTDIERVAAALTHSLPALRGLRSQALHGDCHAENVLVGDAGMICGILDFGDMLHAPLVMEPAVAMAETLLSGVVQPDALEQLLAGYVATLPLAADEVAVLYDLVAARLASTLLVHAWRDRHDSDGARLLDAAAARAAPSLGALLHRGRNATIRAWRRAAGLPTAEGAGIDLSRRHRLLGVGAELFYEQPLQFVRGEGVWLYDLRAQPYLDVYNNVAHVGHSHPAVVRAIQKQTALLTTHTRYLHESILEYAEQLIARCPPHLDACIFVNSGSEANDVAWRMACFATGHAGGLVMAHAYHGITAAVASLTPSLGGPRDAHVATLAPPPTDSSPERASGAADLEAARADAVRAIRLLATRGIEPAAFFIDTALTSSGIFDPPSDWLDAVVAPVRAAGGLVVADEVQYGLGRAGSHFWGFERRGLSPDMITLGKPVGNGYPMGVVIANRTLIEAFQAEFSFFSTFGGNPVAASAGLAVLDVLDREGLMLNARSTGEYLRRGLHRLGEEFDCVGAVRGTGLLLGLEIRGADAQIAKRRTREIIDSLAASAHVLIGYEGPLANLLKMRPPMPFRPEHADLLVHAIGAAAAAIDARA